MSAPDAASEGPPLSKARRAGNLLFVSGQLPRNAQGQIIPGDIAAQATQALANLKAILEANGASLQNIVKVTVWLTDASYGEAFNRVYREWFKPPYPARSVVVSQLVAAADIEIEAVAFLE
ncbi:MAG TPA: RidA family protein [Rhizomicrobium sp.]